MDTNCLLDLDALKSLKQLEGIHETRIIIPKIGKYGYKIFYFVEHLVLVASYNYRSITSGKVKTESAKS